MYVKNLTLVEAPCELANGTCSFRRQHICLVCKKPKCKKIKHFPASSQPTINIADSQSNIEPLQQQVIIDQLQNLNSNMTTVSARLIGTTRELWPSSKTKSLRMTSKLGIPLSVMSNPEAGKLVINMDVQPCNERP